MSSSLSFLFHQQGVADCCQLAFGSLRFNSACYNSREYWRFAVSRKTLTQNRKKRGERNDVAKNSNASRIVASKAVIFWKKRSVWLNNTTRLNISHLEPQNRQLRTIFFFLDFGIYGLSNSSVRKSITLSRHRTCSVRLLVFKQYWYICYGLVAAFQGIDRRSCAQA